MNSKRAFSVASPALTRHTIAPQAAEVKHRREGGLFPSLRCRASWKLLVFRINRESAVGWMGDVTPRRTRGAPLGGWGPS
jgi:hypothetical protein